MTKQLTLVPDNSVASAPASSETATSDQAPRSVSAAVPATRAGTETSSDGPDTESEWRLDDATVKIGLRGIAAARAALTDSANAKAARDAETRATAA